MSGLSPAQELEITMADLATVSVPIVGGVPEVAAVDTAATSTGDTAAIGPGHFLYVANGDASSKTVTLATAGTEKGLAIADATLVVPATSAGIIPLDSVFRGATGRATITYSAVTSVTVAVFKLED
jgi:hypothetical protein